MELQIKNVRTDSLGQRFTSLMKLVDVASTFRDLGGALPGLVSVFRQFSQDYYEYFDQPNRRGVAPLSRAVGQLQQEWANISRACEQRQILEFKQYLAGGYTADQNESADSQALRYYARFRGWKPAPVPVVFFGKLAAITRYPFTPYALISIPFEYYDQPDQWQALAHELGHQIFWNSLPLDRFKAMQDGLRSALVNKLNAVAPQDYHEYLERQTLVEIWMRWFEEVFADICGTLLAGPAFFLSALRRAREAEQLNFDDFGHPVPYLRPLICLETLRWVLEDHEHQGVLELFGQDYRQMREDGDALMHLQENVQMAQVSALTRDIVRTILEGAWLDQDEQPTTLGALVDCAPWLRLLPDIEVRPVATALPPVDPAPVDEATFTRLKDYVEATIRAARNLREGETLDDKVFDALLSLDLGQEQAFYNGYGFYKVTYQFTNLASVHLYTVSR